MNVLENSPRPGRLLFWLANGVFVVLMLAFIVLPRVYKTSNVESAPAKYAFHGQELPPGRLGADFALTDQDGKPFSLSSQQGKAVLLFFGFTHCPNICPTTLANAAILYRRLTPAEQKRVQVLFITVDPDRDDAAALKAYVPFFDPSFIGLTGTPEQIASVAKNYGVSYEKAIQSSQVAANTYTINHSVYTYLLNPAGQLVVLYDSATLRDAAAMTSDLRHLLEGAQP